MNFIKKITMICVLSLGFTSCSTEPISQATETATETSRRPNIDGYYNSEPAWFAEFKAWYKLDPVIGEYLYVGQVSSSDLAQGDWMYQCLGLGYECIYETSLISHVNSGGTPVVYGLQGATLNIKLLEPHITHEAFFDGIAVTESAINAFDKHFNFFELKEDARINDAEILDILGYTPGQQIVIPAGIYPIDHSASQFGTIQLPVQ